MKEDCPPSSHVPISNSKSILKSELLSLLKTYNCYHEGRSFQLRHREGPVWGCWVCVNELAEMFQVGLGSLQ
uniref:Uncharacterized protein n=1 Tax=Equus caballus TaxID=9796 RepID=A0A9L0S7D0_HORSE